MRIMEEIGVSVNYSRWKEINESSKWQDGIFYTLCSAYALLSFVALVQLLRIHLSTIDYGFTTQKIFHILQFILNGGRAFVFGFHKKVFTLHPKVLTMVLFDLPGIIFFTAFTLLVLFWAEIYYQAKSWSTDKLKVIYGSVNAKIYFIQVGIWIFIKEDYGKEYARKLYFAAVSLAGALAFLKYGLQLYLMLKRFPVESKGRLNKMFEVASTTTICSTCFLIRCIWVAVSAFKSDASIDVQDHPVLSLIYYTLFEIVASAEVMYILRKLPPKRKATHYEPSLGHLYSYFYYWAGIWLFNEI